MVDGSQHSRPTDPAPEVLDQIKAGAPTGAEHHSLSVPELGEKIAAEIGIDEAKAVRAVEIVQQEHSQEYSGPIPSAIELRNFNEISPNLGTDIARDFLAHRQHERSMDLQMINLAQSDAKRKDGWLSYARRGQSFGLFSQFIFVLAAFAAIYLHQIVIAGLFVAAPALSVISQFIKGAGQDSSSQGDKSSPVSDKGSAEPS